MKTVINHQPPEYIIGSRICLSVIRQGAYILGEYRRWISYVYGYLKGLKGQSAGYVKIESRSGKCKIYTNIKAPFSSATSLRIYVFYRQDKKVVLVDLGTASMKKGFCEYTYETEDGNIAGSGFALEQLGGLVAIVDESRHFGTVWDDKELDLEGALYFKDLENASEKNAEGSIDNKESLEGVISIRTEDEVRDDETDTEENRDDSGYEEEIEKEIAVEIQNEDIDGDVDDNIKGSSIEGSVENCSPILLDEGRFIDTEKDSVERIFARYPGMYPFEDDEIIECVKLEPQDIGIFPMEKWVLANNSFLLHGYYTYRHLIFAKLRGENETEMYILGVPGLYRDRERFMAGMFGFDKFKGVRGTQRDYGEFGYWYMNMNL